MQPSNLVKRQLEVSSRLILGNVDGVDGQGLLVRLPGQGESMNWVIGHVAVNEDWFLNLLVGDSLALDGAWHRLYGDDASPPASVDAAAPWDELLDAFRHTRARIHAALEADDPATWNDPAPPGLPGIFSRRGDVWGLIGTHPFWHVGHLATIRPMLGLEPFVLD